MRSITLIIFNLCLVLCFAVKGQNNLSSDNVKNLKANLEFLASDALKGRDSGSESEKIAAAFIVSEFKKYGIIPFYDSAYFQKFQLYSKTISDSTNITFLGADFNHTYSSNETMVPSSYFIPGEFEGEVIFAGYGITAPEFNYNDYLEIEVKDKIVVVKEGEPDSKNAEYFNGKNPTKYSQIFDYKLKLAEEKGAKALIVLTSKKKVNPDEGSRIRKQEYSGDISLYPNKFSIEIPVMFLNEDTYDYLKLKNRHASNLNVRIKISKQFNLYDCNNVIGLIPGTDPILKNEYVIVGAHYDHIGTIDNQVFNGANDNASGTAVVMELARIFSEQKNNKRTLIFCLWSAEELGLIGSKYFVNSLKDKNQVKAYVNLDCIGRGYAENITCIHNLDKKSFSYISDICNENSLKITYLEEYPVGASDDIFFRNNEIPSLSLLSGFEKENITWQDLEKLLDIHLPTDDYERIDFSKIEKTTALSYSLLERFSNDNMLLSIREEKLTEFKGLNYISCTVDATILKDRKIKLTLKARSEEKESYIFFREERFDGGRSLSKYVKVIPSNSIDWKEYSEEERISSNAERVVFGAFINNDGGLYIDDFKLSYLDNDLNWQELIIEGSDFQIDDISELSGKWTVRDGDKMELLKMDNNSDNKYLKISN